MDKEKIKEAEELWAFVLEHLWQSWMWKKLLVETIDQILQKFQLPLNIRNTTQA